MDTISTTTNYKDEAMETSKAGVDLQKGENPISSKVAELLLDLLVLAATMPSSSSLRLFLCAIRVAAATVRDGGGGGSNPVDSVCVNTGHSTRDPVPGRSSILRQEGPLASYHGSTSPLDGTIPARALEATRSAVGPAALSLGATEPSTSASAGAVGGLAAAIAAQVVWTPVDVISQRLMVQGNSSPASRYRGGLDAFRSTASGEGDCGGGLLHSIRIWITAAGSHPVRCSCRSLVVGPEFYGVGPASGGVTCTGLRYTVDVAKLEIFSWKLHASWWAPLAWGPTFQRVLHAVLCVVLSHSLVKTRGLRAQLLMVMGATGLPMELHPPFLFIFFYISTFYYVMLRACTFTFIPSDTKLACTSIMQPQILPI